MYYSIPVIFIRFALLKLKKQLCCSSPSTFNHFYFFLYSSRPALEQKTKTNNWITIFPPPTNRYYPGKNLEKQVLKYLAKALQQIYHWRIFCLLQKFCWSSSSNIYIPPKSPMNLPCDSAPNTWNSILNGVSNWLSVATAKSNLINHFNN